MSSDQEPTEEDKIIEEELPPDHESQSPEGKKQKFIDQAQKHLAKVTAAQEAATQAQEEAEKLEDPEERETALAEAAKQNDIAKREMKIVQRLQSGVWQGGLGGAGIGAGVGMGVGTAVGTLVGGVTAIPTTGLGALIGVGTGAIHGPWAKLPEGPRGEGQGDAEDNKKQAKESGKGEG